MEEAFEVIRDLKDEDNMKEVDSPQKIMKKQSKNKYLQEVEEKKIFLEEEGMIKSQIQ